MKKGDLRLVWNFYKDIALAPIVAKAATYGEEKGIKDLFESIRNDNQRSICFYCHGVINRPQCFYSNNLDINKSNYWVISNSKTDCKKQLADIGADEYKTIVISHKKCCKNFYKGNK